MAEGAPIQGLRISLRFADSQNPVEILNNLNLDIRDLDVIRDISTEGFEQSDLRSLSGLEVDLEKETIGILNETQTYQNILSTLNDGRRRIGGNLNISGSIVAPTFKFRTVDFDDNNAIRTVDFSTSRASAWSAFGNAEDSVFYGGDVLLTEETIDVVASLEEELVDMREGANSTIEFSSLEFTTQPKQKIFESQIPTHKIRVNIDNENYDLYAMKGIPIQFKCFFRSVRDLRVDFNILETIRPSWIVRNIEDGQEFVFENRISGSGANRQSIISIFDSRAREREVEFYYPVDRITRIDLNNTRLFNLPNVILPNLVTFNAVNSDLIEMPNIAVLYPKISTLDLSISDLTRSDDPNLATFSPAVIDRLKTPTNTLRTLILSRAYSNESTADLSELVGLTRFISNSTATNSRRMTGTSPAIGTALLTYDIRGNNFSALHPSVLESNSLRELFIRSNNITGDLNIPTLNLDNIESFITGSNSHAIFDLSGKTNLKSYNTSDQSFSINNIGTNIFVGCTSLEDIFVQRTTVSGALPNFSSNTALRRVFSWSTRWSDATAQNSIGENTFGATDGGCRQTLDYFNLQSGNLRGPIHPNAFRNMPSIRTIVVRSYDRGITGPYPVSLNECFNLRTLRMDRNQMSGELPNFAGNKRLVTLILNNNSFSGTIPTINLDFLRTFVVNNNNISLIQGLNTSNLLTLNASSNQLSIVPILEGSSRLRVLLISDNPGMRYRPEELISLTSLRRIELANNGFNTGTVDRILTDLNENYNLNPRSNVTVSLIGNSAPSATEEIASIINRLRREGWTIGLDT